MPVRSSSYFTRRAILGSVELLRRRSVGAAGASPSSRRPDQNNTNLLPGNHLGGPIDVTIDEDCGDWVSARHRMIGKKDHRLAARRNLDRAANDALAGQLLPLLRDVVLQRLTL